ncbi:phosphoinositide phospholipase C 2-like [Vitis riparia]|uniref:phosphoinositide phospholipase C 2-like n=1 Tax=Vitis riparia TaxID=96939 RepID=UPI00155A1024|nr:phosphoinositide phospholipase C 2-like [Vitis riparia]
MSKQSFKVCFCFRRIFKLQATGPPEDVQYLFNRYSQDGTMTLDQLRYFLIDFQEEKHATREDAQAIFNSLKHLNIFQRKGLHLEAFFRYLLGDLNTSLPPSPTVHHDMTAPLSHYFLFTGHNSYLTGNQLSSNSSVKPIIDALRRNVRVIELDLWANDKKDNVEVRHGGTATSPVELIKCLRAIKENAFYASEYPVIITFEDHLTRNLQEKVAKMVTETFGDMLFRPESEYLPEFPSPESLKKKIVISTKPPKEYLDIESNTKGRAGTKKMKDSADEQPRTKEKHSSRDKIEIEGTVNEAKLEEEEELHQDEDLQNAVPDYRRLIAIHAGKLKGGLESWLSIDPYRVRRLSLSEQELENAVKTHGTEIVRFTQRNLLRIYPKGTRIDSSNYNPFVGWMHGAQMVAFNMQGHGKPLQIMQGMFRANGGCGYVKKPDFLLEVGANNEVFDPSAPFPVIKVLKVTVYMGEGWHLDFRHTHFDLYSPPDFFVKVGIVGAPADTRTKETKPIEDDWTPSWNDTFEFPLTVPELAILRVEVREYDTSGKSEFAGQTCLPIAELRSGIRAVPLHNRKGEKYKSVKLLMCFKFEDTNLSNESSL